MTPRPFNSSRLLPVVLALAVLVSACSTTRAPVWVDTQVPSQSESLVYEVIHLSLQKAGYPIGTGADRAQRTIETGWYRSESPFKGKGYRQRAHVNYGPVEDGRYGIQIRVERETNESVRPLDPRFAKWTAAPDNGREAQRILQYVRAFLSSDDIEIGPGPRKTGPR
jgi:hypothetical protein